MTVHVCTSAHSELETMNDNVDNNNNNDPQGVIAPPQEDDDNDVDIDFDVDVDNLDDDEDQQGDGGGDENNGNNNNGAPDDEDRNANDEGEEDNILDGGFAEAPDQESREEKVDITLFFECAAGLPKFSDHAILTPGTTVQIGFEKNTKLKYVMQRYITLCNQSLTPEGEHVQLSDLEFRHVEILSPDLTAESAALMKSDRVYVQPNQADERKREQEALRCQRLADVDFLENTVGAVLLKKAPYGNVVLQCMGSNDMEEHGDDSDEKQRQVRCHDFILKKRCPWLYDIVKTTRTKQLENRQVSDPPVDVRDDCAQDDEADGVMPMMMDQPRAPFPAASMPAAEIENDDDEATRQEESLHDATFVTLDYSPSAAKLLIEYIYTNRVIGLGRQAFLAAHESNDENPLAPVPLEPSIWPSSSSSSSSFKSDIVHLSIILEGLALANEANSCRLALMMEIAASQQVRSHNVAELLRAPERYPHFSLDTESHTLRNSVMRVILQSASGGSSMITKRKDFVMESVEQVLKEQQQPKKKQRRDESVDESPGLVGMLLQGTVDALKRASYLSTNPDRDEGWYRRAMGTISPCHTTITTKGTKIWYADQDTKDYYARERERYNRRLERHRANPDCFPHPDTCTSTRPSHSKPAVAAALAGVVAYGGHTRRSKKKDRSLVTMRVSRSSRPNNGGSSGGSYRMGRSQFR